MNDPHISQSAPVSAPEAGTAPVEKAAAANAAGLTVKVNRSVTIHPDGTVENHTPAAADAVGVPAPSPTDEQLADWNLWHHVPPVQHSRADTSAAALPDDRPLYSTRQKAARYDYLRATTTAIRDPETGERIECTPEQFDAAIDRGMHRAAAKGAAGQEGA